MKKAWNLIRLSIAMALLFCFPYLVGCYSGDRPTREDEQRRGLHDRMAALYTNYLVGDPNHSRQSLLQSIELLEKATFLKGAESAFGLWLGYARLVVVEINAGNTNEAEAYLLKARYWRLKEIESSGDSTEEAMRKVNLLSIKKCMDIVDEFDRGSKEAVLKNSRHDGRRDP